MSIIYSTESISPVIGKVISKLSTCGSDKDTIYIVPEGIKAAVERMVISSVIERDGMYEGMAEDIPVNASFVKGDVLSFIKFAKRMLDMCGRDSQSSSDTIVMRNAIYRVLAEHTGEFEVLGKLVGKFEYIDMLINLIGDFTRYGIDEDKVCEAYELIEDSQDEEVYKSKLHDVKLLMGYLNELSGEFEMNLMSDSISEVNKLLEALAKDKSLLNKRRYRELASYLNSRIVILGFGTARAFTPEELTLITLLDSIGTELIITSLYKEDSDSKLFEFGNATVRMLMDKIPGITVCPLEDDECDEYLSIASAFANEGYISDADKVKTDKIISTSIRQLDDRLSYIANEIIKLTREGNYRYKDIRIVCVDEGIIPRFRSVLEVFNLDAFIDHKIVISNTPVFRFVSGILELPLHNYDYQDVLRVLRTGLAHVLPEDCDLLENYCVKYNITNQNRLFEKDFFVSAAKDGEVSKYADRVYRNGHLVTTAEYLWDRVITRILIPIREVAEEIKSATTISGKALRIAEYIDTYSSNIESLAVEFDENGNSDRASALIRGHKEVMSILASFTDKMNEVEISHEAFCSLIRIDMRNKTQGSIPLKIDSVEIVPVNQAYLTDCKIMFVVGATNDNFPYSSTSEGIMTRDELAKMAEDMKVDLPDKALTKNKSEFIMASLLFGTVKDKLYIVDEYKGETSNPCAYFASFANEVNINCFIAPIYGENVVRRHEFTSAKINSDTVCALLDGGARASVTAIEKYNTCPMQFMLEDILDIRERESSIGIQPKYVGTILHHMFETTLDRLSKIYTTPETLAEYGKQLSEDKELLDKEAKKAFMDYVNSSSNPNEKTHEYAINPGRKAIRIFSHSLPQMLAELGASGYIPSEFEARIQAFDNPLNYVTDNGIDFQFRGSIDRVDKSFEGDALRIIDYKTGDKKFDITKTFAGVQIQLFAYAKALLDRGDEVDDAGYFELGLKADRKGKPLVLKPAFTNLEPEEFDVVTRYVDYVINKSCNDITNGIADACLNSKEYSTTMPHCEWCAFAGSCGNNPIHPLLNCKRKLIKPEGTGNGWQKEEALRKMQEIMDNNE